MQNVIFDPTSFTVPKAKPLPVILLLDVSSSMQGEKISSLNEAVKVMIDKFADTSKIEIEIQVSIITFGAEVKLHIPYTGAKEIVWQSLTAYGNTPMGTAFKMAKAMIEDKQTTPSRAYRPLVVLVSDGEPTDEWKSSLAHFINDGRSSKCDRMAMAIGADANNEVLNMFIGGTTNKLFEADEADQIKDFFKFVTMSVTTRTLSKNPNEVPRLQSSTSNINSENSKSVQQASMISLSLVNVSQADDDDDYF